MDYKFETEFKASVLFECNIAVGGWTYLIIYGKHINGYFCCIPNWKWGCEMAEPNEVAYNSDKLIDCGADPEVARAICKAIQEHENK